MRILVGGGLGFIGTHIVQALQMAGHEPVVLDWMAPGERETAEVITADVCDKDAVEAALHGVDLVCHQAAPRWNHMQTSAAHPFPTQADPVQPDEEQQRTRRVGGNMRRPVVRRPRDNPTCERRKECRQWRSGRHLVQILAATSQPSCNAASAPRHPTGPDAAEPALKPDPLASNSPDATRLSRQVAVNETMAPLHGS